MGACLGLDQLRRDPHPATAFANRPFEHVSHAQLVANLLNVEILPLVGEAGIASDDTQPLNADECGDDLLDHTVGEISLFGVAAQIGKWQYRDRWLIRESEQGKALDLLCSGFPPGSCASPFAAVSSRTINASTGHAMFFRLSAPSSSNARRAAPAHDPGLLA